MPDERPTLSLYSLPPVTVALTKFQEAVLACEAPRIVMISPPGSGATTAGILWSLRSFLDERSSHGLIAAASWSHVEHCVLPHLRFYLDALRDDDVSYEEDRRRVVVATNHRSILDLYGADTRHQPLGPDLGHVYIDALEEWSEESRALIDDLLYRNPERVLVSTNGTARRFWKDWGQEWRSAAVLDARDYLSQNYLATNTQ